jgi:hypothetical protein
MHGKQMRAAVDAARADDESASVEAETADDQFVFECAALVSDEISSDL